jgi:hypothetical protein
MLLLYGLGMFLPFSVLILQMLSRWATFYSIKLGCISKKIKGIKKGKLSEKLSSVRLNMLSALIAFSTVKEFR